MVFKPHVYQQYCIDRLLADPMLGLFLACGLGKTVTTLTAVRMLKYDRFQVGRVLVVAPKKVAEATWQSEAQKWDHLRLRQASLKLKDSPAFVSGLKTCTITIQCNSNT